MLNSSRILTLRVSDFDAVFLTLVGCGGTGSHLASGLATLAQALEGQGTRVEMEFIDGDVVEEGNIGRQLFGPVDVGKPKAEVLAERLNAAFGLRVMASAREIDALDDFRVLEAGTLSVVVGAVDNGAARRMIQKQTLDGDGGGNSRLWWLDCGNEAHSGQVGIGCCSKKGMRQAVDELGMLDRLPMPSVIWPNLATNEEQQRRRPGGTCAAAMAGGAQGLMVNRMAAGWALALLYDFLVAREMRWFALAFNLQWGTTRAYTLDLESLAEATGLASDELMWQV